METGVTFDLQEFSLHDGPGIRLTVFMKGCPLRCNWCHNPEGFEPETQILRCNGRERSIGRKWTSQELIAHIALQADILRNSGGGVTFSGGEVLSQADFVLETIRGLDGLHVAIETSGYGSTSNFRALTKAVDLVFFDLKLADAEAHKRYTGADNSLIRANLEYLKSQRKAFIARIALIPGITDTDDNLNALAGWLYGDSGLQRVELLSCNPAAGGKYASLGMEFRPEYDEYKAPNCNMQPFNDLNITTVIM
ncbi:MAG: radical SAM protein [Victivallales bacterium]|nr:radical SAM protein [Victivallales bacterium]